MSPKKSGGVGLYLSNTIDYTVCQDLSLSLDACEDIWVNVTMSESQNLIIGVIYRRQFSLKNDDVFTEIFCNILTYLNQKKLKYLIVGDFNINLMKYNVAQNVTNYMNSINSTGCNILIDKPTRIDNRSKSASCLDHVYSNLISENLDNYVVWADVSDHFGTLTRIEGFSYRVENQKLYSRQTNLNVIE